MKLFIVFSWIMLLLGCPSGKKGNGRVEGGMEYEKAPVPPIPPEKLCYELQNNNTLSTMELTKVSDSVFGRLNHPIGIDLADVSFRGEINGDLLFVTFTGKRHDSIVSEEQEWRMEGDSLFHEITELSPGDSSEAKIAANEVESRKMAYRKVSCK